MGDADASHIYDIRSLVELANLALEWTAGELLESSPKLIFLRGEMGSGKTTFVTKAADVLGAPDAASPSFALHTRYEGVRGTIDHFDLDRLESADDLESTGFWDTISEARSSSGSHFVMIEWAKRLDDFGFGSEGAAWTKGFRAWNFQFADADSNTGSGSSDGVLSSRRIVARHLR